MCEPPHRHPAAAGPPANASADATGSSPDLKLAYATEGGAADPYAGFETRVVPENVTLLPKTKDQVTGGNPTNERVHLVKKGDSVDVVILIIAKFSPARSCTFGRSSRASPHRAASLVRDLMALFRAALKDENLAGVGCARSRLVRVNPSKRLTPGAFPAPRTVALVHASQRR